MPDEFVDTPLPTQVDSAPGQVTHGPGAAHLDPTLPSEFIDAPAPTGPGVGGLQQMEANPLSKMSEDDLIKRFGGDPAQVKKAANYSPGMFTRAANADWGHLDRLAYGYEDVVKGIGQIGRHLRIGSDQDPMHILQNLHDYRYEQEKPQGTDVMRGIGNAVGVATTVPSAPGVTGAMMAGAGAGLVQPVKNENSPDFWMQKVGQAGIGAATSGYLHSLFNPMVNAAGSAINAGLQRGANWVEGHTPQGVQSELLKRMANTPFTGEEDLDAAIAKGSGPRYEAAVKLKQQLIALRGGQGATIGPMYHGGARIPTEQLDPNSFWTNDKDMAQSYVETLGKVNRNDRYSPKISREQVIEMGKKYGVDVPGNFADSIRYHSGKDDLLISRNEISKEWDSNLIANKSEPTPINPLFLKDIDDFYKSIKSPKGTPGILHTSHLDIQNMADEDDVVNAAMTVYRRHGIDFDENDPDERFEGWRLISPPAPKDVGNEGSDPFYAEIRSELIRKGFDGAKVKDWGVGGSEIEGHSIIPLRSGQVKLSPQTAIGAKEPTQGNIFGASLQLKSIQAKLGSDANYARVGEMIGAADLHPDPTGPVSVLNGIIAKETGPGASMLPDAQRSQLIQDLTVLRDNLAKGGQPYTAFDSTRKVLGDKLDAYFKGTNGVIGKTGSQYITEIDNSLGKAMTDAVQKTGNHALIAAQADADNAYSKMVGTFRDPEIVKAMTSDNPSSIISALSRSGGPNTRIDQEQRLWNALEPKGRLAGMAGMADFAIRKMQLKGNNDPMDFVSGMKDQTDAYHVFFHGDEATRMKGVISTIKVIDKISKALGPVEGAAVGALGGGATAGSFSPVAGGLGAVAGGIVGAKELGGIGSKLTGDGLKWLLTSPQSADFLRKMASMPPGSSVAAQFVTRQLPKVMAGYAAKQRFDQEMAAPEQPSPMSLPSVESLK